MRAELSVAVLIVAVEVSRACVDHNHIGATDFLYVGFDLLEHFSDAKGSRDKVHVHAIWIKIQVMRHRNPSHANVVWIFTSKVNNASLLNLTIAKRPSKHR